MLDKEGRGLSSLRLTDKSRRGSFGSVTASEVQVRWGVGGDVASAATVVVVQYPWVRVDVIVADVVAVAYVVADADAEVE